MSIVEFSMDRYAEVLRLWQQCEGVGLSAADERAAIAAYLVRNPGLSFVALQDGRVVGAVLAGHDGRRGYLHHLAVAPAHRRQGLGRQLVDHALAGLAEQGIQKCHLFIIRSNRAGAAFWQRVGWQVREDIGIVSADLSVGYQG